MSGGGGGRPERERLRRDHGPPAGTGTDGTVDEFLDAINATVIAVDRPVAGLAARLRGRYRSLRLPDALSLATALAADAELVTVDSRLSRIETREKTLP